METLKLNKTIYGSTKAHDSLEKEFIEFVPKKYTIDDLFDMYNVLFYDMIKEGKKHSHFNIIQKSIRYAGHPINPLDSDIEELKRQIQDIEDDIWSIENEHPHFKNGSVIKSKNGDDEYFMQSGRRRKILSNGAMELIKRRAGKKGIPTNLFVVEVSSDCLGGILVGPDINKVDDLNIDIMELNRFDQSQFSNELEIE